MNPLDIIYCKNCKHFNSKRVNKDSIIYECKRNSLKFELTEPQLFCYKKCYNNKIIK